MNAQFRARNRLPPELHCDARFVLSRKDFIPAYVKAHEDGSLQERARQAVASLQSCRVCPRDCGTNRFNNQIGVCKSGRLARVASAFPHFGEEDCLRGWNGSGTIFFSGCNLRCVFCQNFETSQRNVGAEVTAEQLARAMLDLQVAGCHNINFVTPEHVVPHLLEALTLAVGRGLRLPLVYNTSAYDSLESIRLMDGLVDIYMPDFKLWNPGHCAKYLGARDYADAARTAIAAMHGQVGELKLDEDGLALRGVLVRHLVMPGLLDDTREIFHWLAVTLSRDTYVNVMDQYRPAHKARSEPRSGPINRQVKEAEFEKALGHACALGLWRFDTRWRNPASAGRSTWIF